MAESPQQGRCFGSGTLGGGGVVRGAGSQRGTSEVQLMSLVMARAEGEVTVQSRSGRSSAEGV